MVINLRAPGLSLFRLPLMVWFQGSVHAHASLSSTPTALPTGKLGLWWFLSSEIITFGGLMGSYMVLRLVHPEWAEAAQHLNVVIATVNTLVLLTSSLTMVLAFLV